MRFQVAEADAGGLDLPFPPFGADVRWHFRDQWLVGAGVADIKDLDVPVGEPMLRAHVRSPQIDPQA